MSRAAAVASLVVALIATLNGQGQQPAANQPPAPSRALPQVTQEFISVDAPVVVLQHVRVIDGTGAPAVNDQTIVIEGGLIKSIGPSGSTPPPAGARVLDLAGRSVMPGWVGMHEHLFYTGLDRPGPHPRRARVLPDDGLQLPAAVSGGGRDDDPHGRQHGAVRGSRGQALHRRRPHPRPEDAPHRPVPPGRGRRICCSCTR